MSRIRTEGILAWTLAGLSVLTIHALMVWLLTIPAVFSVYYPWLVRSGHTRDAVTVVRWLSSSQRERSLALAVTDRKLGLKELRHFSDVRRVFQRLPGCAGCLVLLTGGLALIGGGSVLNQVPSRGLMVWAGLLVLGGGLAVGDWATFFAWAHRPMFGDRSWRLPADAYSLVLFPTGLWRSLAAAVLLAPGPLLAALTVARRRVSAGSGVAGASSPNQVAPAEKTPTTP